MFFVVYLRDCALKITALLQCLLVGVKEIAIPWEKQCRINSYLALVLDEA